jgi:hypothetical protein
MISVPSHREFPLIERKRQSENPENAGHCAHGGPACLLFSTGCIEMESIRCDARRVTRRLLDNSPTRIKASCLQDAIKNVCGTFPSSLGHGEFPLLFSLLTTLAVSVSKNKRRRPLTNNFVFPRIADEAPGFPLACQLHLPQPTCRKPSMKKRTGRSKGALDGT